MTAELSTWAGLSTHSAQTQARLSGLVALLEKWNRAINLVAPGTIGDVWQRHVADSAQVFDHCPPDARHWLDLGSGGGFPGLVVAILAAEHRPELQVEMVESDQRKCVFLQTALQTLGVPAKVTRSRIEDLAPRQAQVVSARALAALPVLCGFALPHLASGGLCLFLKGASISAEVDAARRSYRFDLTLFPSHTDPSGVVALLSGLSHV